MPGWLVRRYGLRGTGCPPDTVSLIPRCCMSSSSSVPSPPPADAISRSRLAQWLFGISLVLIALNLRPLFSSLSVMLPDILRETTLSAAQAGYLTTLPVICLGLFSPLAPRLSERIGPERTLLLVLVVLGVGTAWRSAGDLYSLYIGTAVAGAAIAVGNVLLPAVIKRDFPRHTALMTGLCTMGLCGGAALASGLTLPLATWFGGTWQVGLAMWAGLALLVLLLWLPQVPGARGRVHHRRPSIKGLWRDPLAWQVTFFMGLQSSLAYCLFGWAIPILRDRGLEGVQAGLVISVSLLVQVGVSIIVPSWAMRCRDQRVFNVVLVCIAVAGFLGFVLAPLSTVWFWAVVQGVGQGGLFAIALTVIVLRSADSRVAAHLSGMAQGGGYLLAALGPLFIGVLFDLTGSYYVVAGWVVLLGIGGALSGWGAGRNRHVRVPE